MNLAAATPAQTLIGGKLTVQAPGKLALAAGGDLDITSCNLAGGGSSFPFSCPLDPVSPRACRAGQFDIGTGGTIKIKGASANLVVRPRPWVNLPSTRCSALDWCVHLHGCGHHGQRNCRHRGRVDPVGGLQPQLQLDPAQLGPSACLALSQRALTP